MGAIRKRGDVWCIDFRHRGKRYVKAVGSDKRQAELTLKKVEKALRRGNTLIDISKHVVTPEKERNLAGAYIDEMMWPIFKKHRQYVDEKLKLLCPEALDQFIAVCRRLAEGDSEARSQALLSCRRILKTLADELYPAKQNRVICTNGKKRKLTEDKYVARLWQFVAEKIKTKKTGQLLLAQIKDLGNRIDRLYDLTSKGVHGEPSEFEVNQCVIQMYFTVGDILRLTDENSTTLEDSSNNLQKVLKSLIVKRDF